MPAVVAAVAKQEPAPEHILVWHNAPSDEMVPGVVNVWSEVNMRCRARHALGLLCCSEAVVFLDDDVLLTSPHALAPLLAGLSEHPESVVGPEGRRCLSAAEPRYWGEGSQRAAHEAMPVSVVKGKLHAVRRPLLRHAFAHELPVEVWTEDDIVLCAEVQTATGNPPWAVAGMRGLYRNLGDEQGNEKRPGHFALRDAACRHMAGLGWNPEGWRAWKL
jgi:hypothetical protein